ncbi:MAG TPA: hypothetical protein PKI44_00860 [Candidatus Omnitrophota bacterium]|nr:hypothetical protein [Candidatus Omnitrophota bacterium]
MLNIGIWFQIVILYLSLSSQGKCFLKKAVSQGRRAGKIFQQPAALGPAKILYFIKNFKVCDKVFSAQATDKLCIDLGRNRSAMYSRFVSYGWACLLMWGKVLDAFNLPYDESAKERCVLVAFTHREWNDLFDNQGYSFGELFAAFDYQSAIPKELTFLRKIKHLERKLAPPERFGKFYEQMQGFNICSLFEYTPEKAEVILDQVAPFVALLFIYIMIPEIPGGLKDALKPIARWLYMLDEFADLEHDKQNNRVTYMILVDDPEAAMRQQYERCRQAILRKAPCPDQLIKFMETVTTKVIDAKKKGTDIESSFFNLG